MNFSFNINLLLPLSALILSLGSALYALRYRSKRVPTLFILMLVAVSWWSLASMMENSGESLATKIFWLKMAYPGIVSIPVLWMIFTANFSGKTNWLTWRRGLALSIIPIMTLGFVLTNSIFHLMWKNIWLDTSVSPSADLVTHSAWFWVHATYSYSLLIIGTFYLVRIFQKSDGIYRKQAGLLILAALAPWVGNALFIFGVGPFSLVDPTPLAFAITGVAFLFGLTQLQLLDITPIARDEIFKNMVDGVIVIDAQQRVQDINPAAQSIIKSKRSLIIGRPYNLVMPGPAGLIEFGTDLKDSQIEIPLGDNEDQRYYKMTISAIRKGSRISGHLLVLNDDTQRRKAEVDSRERARLQAELYEREKYTEAIQHQLAFEETVARLSSRFVGLYNVDNAINASLTDLRELSKATRAYLFLLRDSGIEIKNTSKWCVSKDDQNIDYMYELTKSHDSWWMTKLWSKDFINIGDTLNMPAEAAAEKDIFRKNNIRSILVFPVFVKETLAGVIGFDSINNKEDWDDNDIAALRMSSEICTNAIERQISTDLLAQVIEQLQSLNSQLEEKVEERTKQLAEALSTAKASNQAKSEFLASMSHELRTPLNAIIGFSQILNERYFGELNEKQDEYITDILDSGKHLLSLINDILDLSKIEAGKMEFEMSPLKLDQLILNSIVMVKEKALNHHISLDINVQKIAGMEVKGDERRLKQVMFNLLSNATKFTPDGGIITINANPDGGYLSVTVADNGIGITDDEQKHVFEVFYQASGGLKDKTPGTGLGLPITRDIIEKHGGKIWVKSEGQNKGSCFTFTVPVLNSQLIEVEKDAELVEKQG